MATYPDLAHRYEQLRGRIEKSGGDIERLRLIAVTKGFGADAVEAAVVAGIEDVGENYAQEMRAKHAEAKVEARWHFIGKLQTNKVRQLAPLVHVWQSIDRREVLEELAKRAPSAAVFIEVNLTGVPGRAGCPWNETSSLVAAGRELGLEVRGLMGVGEMGDPEASRPLFRRLRELAEAAQLPEVSMGMSDDLEVAVQEGSTMVRVGSALFGERPQSK